MKNIFNLPRKKERGFYPYHVNMDNERKYLFYVSRRTSLKYILKIQEKFSDDELIFATTNEDLSKYVFSIDAANLHEVGGRGKRPLFFFKDGKFFDTWENVEKLKDGNTHKYLTISQWQQKILPYDTGEPHTFTGKSYYKYTHWKCDSCSVISLKTEWKDHNEAISYCPNCGCDDLPF